MLTISPAKHEASHDFSPDGRERLAGTQLTTILNATPIMMLGNVVNAAILF